MKFSAQISSLALAAVLALSGTAYAQTMVAGMSVSAEELPKDATKTDETPDDAASNDEAAVAVSGTDQATTALDLEILTYENCKEAGLVM